MDKNRLIHIMVSRLDDERFLLRGYLPQFLEHGAYGREQGVSSTGILKIRIFFSKKKWRWLSYYSGTQEVVRTGFQKFSFQSDTQSV